MVKRCFKCLCEKPLSDFYKHAMMGDGHLNKCKECTKKDTLANRLAKIEYYRSYDRARGSMPHRVASRQEYMATPAYKAMASAAKRAWEKKHPQKKYAVSVLNKAIRRGKLQRQPCLICGASAEAHHPSYALPLAVVWLCDGHHKQVHKEAREYLRETAPC